MVKRILAGTATLVLLALAVIVISVVQFDVSREKLAGKYAGGASQFVTLPSGASAHVRDEGNPGGPVLVIWGDKDGLIPVSAAYAFKERIPQTDLAIFENAGHVPMEEVPAESAAGVRAFLSKGQAEVAAGPAENAGEAADHPLPESTAAK
ncbi:MAG: alpha/beta hydrolase [Parvibaculum sp.]|nr:alpha/beta hydrolase [Parvibaculum sp.]